MAVEDIGMESGFDSSAAENIAFSVSKQRYDRMMRDKATDPQLKDIYEGAMTYVSGMDRSTKFRLLQTYKSTSDLPSGKVSDKELNELLVRAMISRMSKADLRKVIGTVDINNTRFAGDLAGAYRMRPTIKGFGINNIDDYVDAVSRSRGDMTKLNSSFKRDGLSFTPGKASYHGFRDLFDEIDTILRTFPANVSASGKMTLAEVAMSVGVDAENGIRSRELRGLIASKCCLYLAIILGKHRGRVTMAFGGEIEANIRKLIAQTSYARYVGAAFLSTEEVKERIKAATAADGMSSIASDRVEYEIKRILNTKVKDKDKRSFGSASKLFGGNRFTRSIPFLVWRRKRKANRNNKENNFIGKEGNAEFIKALGNLPNKDQQFKAILSSTFDTVSSKTKEILSRILDAGGNFPLDAYTGSISLGTIGINITGVRSKTPLELDISAFIGIDHPIITNIYKQKDAILKQYPDMDVLTNDTKLLDEQRSIIGNIIASNIAIEADSTDVHAIISQFISLLEYAGNYSTVKDTDKINSLNLIEVLASANNRKLNMIDKVKIISSVENSAYYHMFLRVLKTHLVAIVRNAGIKGLEGDKAEGATLKRLIMAYMERYSFKQAAGERAADPSAIGNRLRKAGLSVLGVFSKKKRGQARSFDATVKAAGNAIGLNTNSEEGVYDAMAQDEAAETEAARGEASGSGADSIKFSNSAEELTKFSQTINSVMSTFSVTGLNHESLTKVTAVEIKSDGSFDAKYALPVFIVGSYVDKYSNKEDEDFEDIDTGETETKSDTDFDKVMSVTKKQIEDAKKNAIKHEDAEALIKLDGAGLLTHTKNKERVNKILNDPVRIKSVMEDIKRNPIAYGVAEDIDMNNDKDIYRAALDYLSSYKYHGLSKDEEKLVKTNEKNEAAMEYMTTNTFVTNNNSSKYSITNLAKKIKDKGLFNKDKKKKKHDLKDKDYWSVYASQYWRSDSVAENIQPVFVTNSYDTMYAKMLDTLEAISASNAYVTNWLNVQAPVLFASLQNVGLTVNAASAGGGIAAALGIAEQAAGMALNAAAGKFATGGTIKASNNIPQPSVTNKTKRAAAEAFATGGQLAPDKTNFISGDSLNTRPNPEMVSVDWASKSVSVKPLHYKDLSPLSDVPAYATGAKNENGETVSRMSLNERKSAMEVAIATGLVRYNNTLRGVEDDKTNTAIKVYQVNSILTDKVTIGETEVSLMDMLYGINTNITIAAAELSNHTQLLSTIASNTARAAINSGSSGSSGDSFSYPTDLNAILRGE